jgi:hypothetical protein
VVSTSTSSVTTPTVAPLPALTVCGVQASKDTRC